MADQEENEELAESGKAGLCEFELQILRECADPAAVASPWGAAVGAALGHLRGSGYMLGNAITPKGRAALLGLKVVR